jgi:hypothetical protein
MRRPGSVTGFLRSREAQRGQSVLAFVILFPMFIICLFIVTDVGRLLYIKNQVRIAADSAALAAAGALDMRQASQEERFVINENWARQRADEALVQMQNQISEDAWMDYRITGFIINGREVTVIVDGTGSTLFGGYLGVSGFSARAISHARAAVGVNSEW